MFIFKFLVIAIFFGYIGYRLGLMSSGFSIGDGDLSDCCGASVIERKETACLSCGKECKIRRDGDSR